ncbi:hypothetical protein B0I35DRAFT_514007 [Stachybotrys elegans]|uniref:Glycoside hydrolase n=1 Tax=Stachybotrys elegans TaxID=80388 RepID=A0A8K0WNX1_9HYPO|nr:hypothetical protein B0I35DRAFT_514007 [Stachybotrys elegans]
MVQLPDAAIGTAVGVLIYSFICLFTSCLVIWLTFQHREWSSYVAGLAYFSTLATTCSIIQQFHTMVSWNDIMEERFWYAKEHIESPELTLTNVSLGVDRVLFYIQYYCYNVEGFLVMFWYYTALAWTLVQSIYRLDDKPKVKKAFKIANRGGKAFAVFFPVIIISSLQALTNNRAVFPILARQPLMCSVGLGVLAIIAILFRYIQSRLKLQQFHVGYGISQSGGTMSDAANSSTLSSNHQAPKKKSMYDRWLVTRFMIGFFIMSLFELSIVMFARNAEDNLRLQVKNDAPNTSAERAINDFRFFIPGVTASLLVFLVFGTTKPFLAYMRQCLFGKNKKRGADVHIESAARQNRETKTSMSKGIELVSPKRAHYSNLDD